MNRILCFLFQQGPCHVGSKASKVVYLGDTGRLMTTGFSKFSDRQWAIWSQQDLSKPLHLETIDSSSGILIPYYDYDTKMVYLVGKVGDSFLMPRSSLFGHHTLNFTLLTRAMATLGIMR